MPIGFCCGGFSSTAGYVPGNEARSAEANQSDIATFRLYLPKDVVCFYPNNLKSPKTLRKQSLSASMQGVITTEDSAYRLFSNRCVTAPLAYPCIGQKPVSNFDYVWILHRIFFKSSRKYFNFSPYFTGILLRVCGKVLRLPVENSVENFGSSFIRRFKIRRIFILKKSNCVKHEISVRKKYFQIEKKLKKSRNP